VALAPPEAALTYASHGWWVFPLFTPDADGTCDCPDTYKADGRCKPGKHPRTQHGDKDATTDAAVIERWWSMWPHANVGVALQPSGLVDIAPDSEYWLARFQALGLERTASFASGGGKGHVHHLYARPEGCPIYRRCEEGGFDLLSNGYAVMPPSLHRLGQRYVWLIDPAEFVPFVPADPGAPLRLPPAPSWAVQMLRGRVERPAPTVPDDDPDSPPVRLSGDSLSLWHGAGPLVPMRADGQVDRSLALVRLATALARGNASRAVIVEALTERDAALGWHKNTDRRDGQQRYGELADGALARLDADPDDNRHLSEGSTPIALQTVAERQPTGFAARLAEATTTLSGLAERYSGEVQWLAEGYLARGELVIVPGPPESFKSWLMADLVRAVQVKGALWLGSLPVLHGRAIYFEQERARNLVYQTQRLAAGWSQNLDDVLAVEPCGIDLCDDDCAAAITALLERERPILAVFNSYKAVFRGRPADSADVSRALQWLGNVADRLNLTVAIVDGDNKLGSLGQLRGMAAHADSIQKEYEADAILHVERKRDEVGRGSGPASVYVGKRRQGESGAPFQFDVIRVDDSSAKVLWLDETTVERNPPPRPSGRDRVLMAAPYTHEGKSRHDIATEAKVAPSTASGLLKALEGDGLVEQAEQFGNWRRPQPSEPSDPLSNQTVQTVPEGQPYEPFEPSDSDTSYGSDGLLGQSPNPTRRLPGGTKCRRCGRELDLGERDAGHCLPGHQGCATA
jgi:hypothetical protein